MSEVVIESSNRLSYSREFLMQYSGTTKVEPTIVEKLTPYISSQMKNAKRGLVPQRSPYATKKVLGEPNVSRPEKRLAKTPNPRTSKTDVLPGQMHMNTDKKLNKRNPRDVNLTSPLQLKPRNLKQNLYAQKENIPTNINISIDQDQGKGDNYSNYEEFRTDIPLKEVNIGAPLPYATESNILNPVSPTVRKTLKPFSPRQVNFRFPTPTLNLADSAPSVPSVVVTNVNPVEPFMPSSPIANTNSASLISPTRSDRTVTPRSISKSPFSRIPGSPIVSPQPGPFKSPSSVTFSPGKSPRSPKSPNRPISPLDEQRLMQRQKQIDYGYRTVGYLRYRLLIAKDQRKPEHPRTPKKTQGCSKRSWDGQLKKWRRDLHLWDPDNMDAFRAMLNSDLVVSIIAANPELAEIVDIVREKMDNPTSPCPGEELEEAATPALEDSIGYSDLSEKKLSPSRMIGNDPNFQRVARALVF